MKRIALLKERQVSAAGAGPASTTGAHCPVSGLWSPESDPHVVEPFFEGQVFPAFDGVPAVWRRRAAGLVSLN